MKPGPYECTIGSVFPVSSGEKQACRKSLRRGKARDTFSGFLQTIGKSREKAANEFRVERGEG
jgi:hypothetical protein